MHICQQIRDAVKTELDAIAGLTVHTNRIDDLETLPAASVITEDEALELSDKDGSIQRDIDLLIVVVADGASATIDDDLDDLAEAIEGKMNTLLGGLVKRLEPVSKSMDLRPDEDGDRWYGWLVMEYRAVTFTPEGDPTTTL